METIVGPDPLLTAVTLLRAGLAAVSEPWADAQVLTHLPAGARPGRVALVRLVGGARTNLVVDQATLDVVVWHDNDHDAMRLAQLLRGVLHAAAGSVVDLGAAGRVTVYDVADFTGPRVLPDPAGARDQVVLLTVSVGLRAAAI